MNIEVPAEIKLRELCKLKFAIYADQVRLTTTVEDESQRLMLSLYHETVGMPPYDHEYLISRAVDEPDFHLVVHTPSWHGQARYYGNSMSVMFPSEPQRFGGKLALSGSLGPWLQQHESSHTADIVKRITKEMTGATALPGQPLTEKWVPDNQAREAAYVASRIPEQSRAWR